MQNKFVAYWMSLLLWGALVNFFGVLGHCALAWNPKCWPGGLGGPLNPPFVDLFSKAIGARFSILAVGMHSSASPFSLICLV